MVKTTSRGTVGFGVSNRVLLGSRETRNLDSGESTGTQREPTSLSIEYRFSISTGSGGEG